MRSWFGLIIGLVLAGGAGGAGAETRAGSPQVIDLLQSLPEKTVKRLRDAPEKFQREAAVLIFGYGENGAIDAAGLERFILLERAEARGRALRRFSDADLDNDGVVAADEIAIKADTLGAAERGRLRLAFGASDIDGDGMVNGAGMRALAEFEAQDDLSDADATVLRGFMLFDLDGSGWVTVAEVKAVGKPVTPDA